MNLFFIFDLINFPKSDILQFIKRISDNEGLKLSDESIDTIQNMFFRYQKYDKFYTIKYDGYLWR